MKVLIQEQEVPMELQIQDLVTSIRKEGVEAANAEAESIIAEARKKAESIISSAKTEAQQYKDAAEKDINILKESAEVGAEQAKRDAVLAFKSEIQAEFEKILATNISKELKGDLNTALDNLYSGRPSPVQPSQPLLRNPCTGNPCGYGNRSQAAHFR